MPVAALGNSDQDLSAAETEPDDPTGVVGGTGGVFDEGGQPISNSCDVVPAESSGVIGTMALGRNSQKAELFQLRCRGCRRRGARRHRHDR